MSGPVLVVRPYFSLEISMILQHVVPPVVLGPVTGGLLPVSAQLVMAWIAFAVAIVSVATQFLRAGRWSQRIEESEQRTIARLNGFGERLTVHEREADARRERDQVHLDSVNEVKNAIRGLAEKIGRAEQVADQCNTNTSDFAIEIGTKIDGLGRDVRSELTDVRETINRDARAMGERMKGVETKMEMMMRNLE